MSDARRTGAASPRWAPAEKRARVLDRSSFQSALMQITGAAEGREDGSDGDKDEEDAIDSGCSSQEGPARRDLSEGVDGSSSEDEEDEEDEEDRRGGTIESENDGDEGAGAPLVRQSWEDLRRAMLVRSTGPVAADEDACEPIEDGAGVLVASTQDCERDVPDTSALVGAAASAAVPRLEDDSSVADLLDDSPDEDAAHTPPPAPAPTPAPTPRSRTLLDTLKAMQPPPRSPRKDEKKAKEDKERREREILSTPRRSTGSRWLRDIDAWRAREGAETPPQRPGRAARRFVAGGLAQRYHRLAFQPRTFRPPALSDRSTPVAVRIVRAHTPPRQGAHLAALCCCTASGAASTDVGAPAVGEGVDVFFALPAEADAEAVLAALSARGAALTAWFPVAAAPCACLLAAQWALGPETAPPCPLPAGVADTPLSRIVGRRPGERAVCDNNEDDLAGVVVAVRAARRGDRARELWARPAFVVTLWQFTGTFCEVFVPSEVVLACTGVQQQLLHVGETIALRGVHRAGCRTVTPTEHAALERLGAAFETTRALPCCEASSAALAVRAVPLPPAARCYPVACPAFPATPRSSRVVLRGTLVAATPRTLVLLPDTQDTEQQHPIAVAAPGRVARALRQRSLLAAISLTDVRCDDGLLALDAFSLVTAETDYPPSSSEGTSGVLWVPRTSTGAVRPVLEDADAGRLLARTSRVVALAGRVVDQQQEQRHARCPACWGAALGFGDGYACERCGTTFRRPAVRTVLTVCPAPTGDTEAALPPVAVAVCGVRKTTRLPVRDATTGRLVPTPLSTLPRGALVAFVPVVVHAVSETLIEALHVPLQQSFDTDDVDEEDEEGENENEEEMEGEEDDTNRTEHTKSPFS